MQNYIDSASGFHLIPRAIDVIRNRLGPSGESVCTKLEAKFLAILMLKDINELQ